MRMPRKAGFCADRDVFCPAADAEHIAGSVRTGVGQQQSLSVIGTPGSRAPAEYEQPVKAIARTLGISRNTGRTALASDWVAVADLSPVLLAGPFAIDGFTSLILTSRSWPDDGLAVRRGDLPVSLAVRCLSVRAGVRCRPLQG